MALQIRRGTNAERLGITLVEGEVVYITDFQLTTISVTSLNASTNTLTTTVNHGLSVNDQVKFTGTTANGLTEGTVYYVKTIPSQTDFTLSTTLGGGTLDITGTWTADLVFATGPTDALGTPYGYSISPLYVGDGITAGGNPAGASILDDLYDVEIGVYGSVGQYGKAIADGHVLVYNDVTNQWENTNIIATSVANDRLVVQYDNSSAGTNSALIVRKNYGATNYTNNDGVGIKFELKSNSQGDDEIAIINAINTSGGINIEFTTTVDDGANYTTPLRLNTNGSTFNSDLNITSETLSINSDNSASNSRIYFNGTNGAITYNRTSNFFDFGNSVSISDLYLSNGTVATGSGALSLNTPSGQPVNVQRDLSVGGNATITGNLTVNGTTTTVNSTTLTVDDKNIELAATGSPSDATADGGGITLKGNTDKKIFWQNSDDYWYFDNGDGTAYRIPAFLTDLADVTITGATKGDLLYYNGSAWVNDNVIEYDNAAQRPRFQINTTDSGVRAGALMVKNTGGTAYTDGDGSGIVIGVVSNSQGPTPNVFSGLSAVYNSAGNHEVRLRTSTDNFLTVEKNILIVNDDDLKVKATEFVLNALGTNAAAVDAQITVERGTTGADAYIKWDEDTDNVANSQWYIGNQTQINGRLSVLGDIFAESSGNLYLDGGSIVLNNGNSPASATITVDRGDNDAVIRWNETSDRWEVSVGGAYTELPNQGLDTDDSPSFAGITGGNVRVGVTGDNEIDTSTGGLTIDSAGGTTTVDDDLVVTNNLSVSGTTTLGNGSDDTASINSGTINLGTPSGFNSTITIGNASSDTLTVNATTTFNNNVTVGSTNADTLTVNGEVTGNIIFTDNAADSTNRGVMGTVGGNDQWFVGGYSSGTNDGYMVIATGDDGNEPIYVRQYNNGSPLVGTTYRQLTLLNASGNTVLPGNIDVQGGTVSDTTGQLSLVSGSSSNVFIDPASGTTMNDGHMILGRLNTTAILNTNGTGNLQLKTGTTNTGLIEIASGDNGNITIEPHGTGNVFLRSSAIQVGDANATATITTNGLGDLVLNTNNGTNSGSITLTQGPDGNITIDPNGTGKVIIAGDLQVDGTTTTINSTTLDVDDKNITIAKGAANAAAADGGGITLEGPATPATLLYEADDDSWNFNKNTNVAGDFTATTAVTRAYTHEDLAGDQIAATIARTVTTTSTGIATVITTNRKAMKVMLVADDGTDTHMIEALVMRDAGEASGAQVTFYGELKTGAALATFTADYDSGTSTIRLRATPASATSTTFKTVRTALF